MISRHIKREKAKREKASLPVDVRDSKTPLLKLPSIDLVTLLEALLTSRQPREKLQCFYEYLMSNNFRKTAVLKKI